MTLSEAYFFWCKIRWSCWMDCWMYVGWIVSVKEIGSEVMFFNKQGDNNSNALFPWFCNNWIARSHPGSIWFKTQLNSEIPMFSKLKDQFRLLGRSADVWLRLFWEDCTSRTSENWSAPHFIICKSQNTL